MVNSPQYGKGWQDVQSEVSITTANGGKLLATKVGGTPGTNIDPSYPPVITGNSKLLQSYMWLPHDDVTNEMDLDDTVPPSLHPYSHQCDAGTHSLPSDVLSFDQVWDRMMMEIEEAGEVIVDLDAIAADLDAELNATVARGGSTIQDPNTMMSIPLLETPCSDAMDDVYDNVSILNSVLEPDADHAELSNPLASPGYTAFAAACSNTQGPMVSDNHLD
ncbi:hypothetical protein NDA12_005851 [Ustilago hordei]|nr:hypothetical protein NDA12_005851 [Ustilago hordei]